MKKILIGLAVIALLATLFLNFTKIPGALPDETDSARFIVTGPHAVAFERSTLNDKSRVTPPNGDFKGADGRELELFIWSPETPLTKPQPLVIYSHGFMSNGNGGEYLGKYLASHGYTVAAATYPLTNYSAPGGANPEDVVNQPADISFVIDALLARNADADDALFQKIDPSRIAAVGMSMGGMTSEMVAYHPQIGDDRIAAAVSIAGPAYMFSKRFFDHRKIPFMMVASPQDALINYQENAANILSKIDGAVLVTVDGASHLGFSGGSKWLRWMDNPDSLGCDQLLQDDNVESESDWYHKIGSEAIGVLPPVTPTMCQSNPLPSAINPLHQLRLTTLAVGGFLGCEFAVNETAGIDHCEFLKSQFAKENPEIRVEY